jgi:PBSX family phage portal protein
MPDQEIINRESMELEVIQTPGENTTYIAEDDGSGELRLRILNADEAPFSILPDEIDDVLTSSADMELIEYDKAKLAELVESSSVLPQCIDAYVQGVHGYEYSLVQVSDLSVDSNRDRFRFELEKSLGRELSDEEFVVELEKQQHKIELEFIDAVDYFDNLAVVDDESVTMTEIGRRTRDDIESLGEAFWELLTDDNGEIVKIVWVPAVAMQISKASSLVEVEELDRDGIYGIKKVSRKRRFRRYFLGGVWFKEFGDPRVVSSESGIYYDDIERLHKEEGVSAQPAHDMIHWKLYSRMSYHGAPRWIGFWPGVYGQRNAEEVNSNFFQNNTIPPLLVIVRGGKLSDNSAKRIEEQITQKQKKKKFHDAMIIEAIPFGRAGTTGKQGAVEIEVRPLTKDIQDDALFLRYMQHNSEQTGEIMRVPPILRGRMKDFNRSTAIISVRVFEEQVTGPERTKYDYRINTVITRRKFRYWKFKSNSPNINDPEIQNRMLVDQFKEGILDYSDARSIAGGIWNMELSTSNGDDLGANNDQPIEDNVNGDGDDDQLAEDDVGNTNDDGDNDE